MTRSRFSSWWSLWSLVFSLTASVLPTPAEAGDPTRTAAPNIAWFVTREQGFVVSIVATRMVRIADVGDEDVLRDPAAGDDSSMPAEVEAIERRVASGFIIDADGHILTSAHAVAAAEELIVSLADRREFGASIVGIDPLTDVAVIKVAAFGLPVARIGDARRLAVGEWVAAIGAPFGLERSVTAGIVSAKRRFLPGAMGLPFIQTDVATNRGSSGGPLFNLRGEVVGMNSLIYSETGGYMGVSFALPIDLAMRIAAALREHGRVVRAQLGAQVQELSPDLAHSFGLETASGALLVSVRPRGPADLAGLRRGDIVLGSDDRPTMNASELLEYVGAATPGRTLTFAVLRRGRSMRVAMSVVAQPAPSWPVPTRPTADVEERLGLVLRETSADSRAAIAAGAGLRVREAHGPALRAGIRAGDLVLAINDMSVERVTEFDAVLAAAPVARPLALLVMRAGVLGYVAVRRHPVRDAPVP